MVRYIIFIAIILGSCQLPKNNQPNDSLAIQKSLAPNQSVYQVLKHVQNKQIRIDGQLDSVWMSAIVHTDFKDRWYHKEAGETKFRSLWDESWFYFIYEVEDDDIVLEQGFDDVEQNAVRSDRVELFFSTDKEDSIYYAFEIDADARVYDSKGKYKNYSDGNWDFPAEDILLASTKNEFGYRVEGKFSKSRLRSLGLLKPNSQLKAGLFRGDYTTNQDTICWISWGKASSPIPNFHLPSALRELRLVDSN